MKRPPKVPAQDTMSTLAATIQTVADAIKVSEAGRVVDQADEQLKKAIEHFLTDGDFTDEEKVNGLVFFQDSPRGVSSYLAALGQDTIQRQYM